MQSSLSTNLGRGWDYLPTSLALLRISLVAMTGILHWICISLWSVAARISVLVFAAAYMGAAYCLKLSLSVASHIWSSSWLSNLMALLSLAANSAAFWRVLKTLFLSPAQALGISARYSSGLGVNADCAWNSSVAEMYMAVKIRCGNQPLSLSHGWLPLYIIHRSILSKYMPCIPLVMQELVASLL